VVDRCFTGTTSRIQVAGVVILIQDQVHLASLQVTLPLPPFPPPTHNLNLLTHDNLLTSPPLS
jgi:hypothetical protein